MNHTVYLKLSQITELTHKDVVLKDVAQVYCDDQNVMNKCNSMKVMTVKVDAKRRPGCNQQVKTAGLHH